MFLALALSVAMVDVVDVLDVNDLDVGVDPDSPTNIGGGEESARSTQVMDDTCKRGSEGENRSFSRSFEISIERLEQSEPLGMDVVYRKAVGMMEVIFVRDGGLIARWNSTASSLQDRILHGDFILSLNGRTGSIRSMVDGIKDELTLRLDVRRMSNFEVSLARDPEGKLGLTVKVEKLSKYLIVLEILEGGPLQRWNAEHPDNAVRPGDIVLEVNGLLGEAGDLAQAMMDPAVPSLHLFLRRGLMPPTALD